MSINPVGNPGNSVTTSTDPSGRTIIDAGAGNDTIHIGKAPGELGKQGMYEVDINGRKQYLTEAELRNTTFRGGKGDDTIKVDENVEVPLTIEGNDGNDEIWSGAGDDKISGGAGNDFIYGHDGRDTIDGGSGDDELLGGADGDVITGGRGNDRLFGGLGDDTILGQQGNDYINSGNGRDTVSGGTGANTYRDGPDGVVDVVVDEGGKMKILPAKPQTSEPAPVPQFPLSSKVKEL